MPGSCLEHNAVVSADYREARSRFTDLCTRKAATLKTYLSTAKGPLGEDLATDVAWLGSTEAERVIVLVSATHGVEGFCGSAAQLDFLTSDLDMAADTGIAVMLVHALNPYGFAHLRRTTHEGIDLNRNGLDFSEPLPDNPGFEELADVMLPRELDGPIFEAAERAIAIFKEKHGDRAFEVARSAGQYTAPHHFFYGGKAPAEAMLTIAKLCSDYKLSERKSVAVIDYHTGLGPFGYGEPICGHKPGEVGQARCRAWYGESLGEPLLGTSSSVPIPGLSQYAWQRHIGKDIMTFIALEFGTYNRDRGRRVLRLDHWLHAYGNYDWQSAETQAIKSQIKHHYFPGSTDWIEMMLFRSRQIIGQTFKGLADLR